MKTAYEWGIDHESCDEALEQRKNYPDQPAWYTACGRGDWLIWQFRKGLNTDELESIKPALLRATNKIVERAIRNHAVNCGIIEVERRASAWLDGSDRTAVEAVAVAVSEAAKAKAFAVAVEVVTVVAAALAAAAAWSAAVGEAAWAAWEAALAAALAAATWAVAVEEAKAKAKELKLQADDIHSEIPVWPGKDV